MEDSVAESKAKDEEITDEQFDLMLVEIVKQIDRRRGDARLDIMDYKDADFGWVRPFILFMLILDESNYSRTTISNPFTETETLQYDATKDDPFKYFWTHWDEFDEKQKHRIYHIIMNRNGIGRYNKENSSFKPESTVISDELEEIQNRFNKLNNLEKKVHLMRYLAVIHDDLEKWDKTGIKMYDDKKKIIDMNERINGWFDELDGDRYLASKYIFKYNIASPLRKEYYFTEIKKWFTVKKGGERVFVILEGIYKETRKVYDFAIISKTMWDEKQATKKNGWYTYIFDRAKHKNVISLIDNLVDSDNYYIITRGYKRDGFIKKVQTKSLDVSIREKLAAACTYDMLLVLKHFKCKNIVFDEKNKFDEQYWELIVNENNENILMFNSYIELNKTKDDDELNKFIQKTLYKIGCLAFMMIIIQNQEEYKKHQWIFPDPTDIEFSEEFKDFVTGLVEKKVISVDDALQHLWLKKADYNPRLYPAKCGLWTILNVINYEPGDSMRLYCWSYYHIIPIDIDRFIVYDYLIRTGSNEQEEEADRYHFGFYIYYVSKNQWIKSKPLKCKDFHPDFDDVKDKKEKYIKLIPRTAKYDKEKQILTIYESTSQQLIEYDLKNDAFHINKYKKQLMYNESAGGYTSSSSSCATFDSQSKQAILVGNELHIFDTERYMTCKPGGGSLYIKCSRKRYSHYVCPYFGERKKIENCIDEISQLLDDELNFINNLEEIIFCKKKQCLFVFGRSSLYKYSLKYKKWNILDPPWKNSSTKGVLCDNEQFIVFFRGYAGISIFDVENEKMVKCKVKLPSGLHLGRYHAISRYECNINKLDLFFDGFMRRMYYGNIQFVPISILELIYSFISTEFIYIISQTGILCKIAVQQLISS